MDKRDTLLIGSDIDSNRVALRNLFQDYYHILEATAAEQALLLLRQNHSIISCVLLDIDHEWASTYKLLEAVHDSPSGAEIPLVVLLSSDISVENEAMMEKHATDLIFKPCSDRALLHRVKTYIGLYQSRSSLQKKLEEQLRLMQHSNDQMIDALSNIIEQRSLESGQHIQRIRGFTRILLEEIAVSWPEYGLDSTKIEMMSNAAVLHDIGKISIPDAILNKPGYLTKDEFEIMQAHTVNGCQILGQLKNVANEEYFRYAYNICRYHHERWDGRGYPDGLRKDEIPICAQAVSIADVYDALTTDRVYKKAYQSERAATMILNGECGAFSSKLLESFKACYPRFVELEQYYKRENNFEYKGDAVRNVSTETAKTGESTTERLQAKHQALLYYQNATVLEADLKTGIFQLIYNPNPDYRVPEGAASFFVFASQVAQEQIHPDDRERYVQEIQHCHGALFHLGQRRHSVYARMKGAATGRYRPYEFSTIRIDSENPDARDVLLVCRPLDETILPGFETVRDDGLEKNPQIQAAFLSNFLFIRHDANLSITGDIGALWELSGYSRQEIAVRFQSSLVELVHPQDRDGLVQSIKEQLDVGTVVNAEFRISSKAGPAVWVLGRFYLYTNPDGEEYFCALLQDNTRIHAKLKHLQEAASYMEVYLQQSEDITFVWDIAAHKVKFDEKWQQRFGHEPCGVRFEESLEGAYHFHPDDIPAMNAFLGKLRDGGPYAEADVRILRVRGGYRWNRFRAGVICDASGKAIKAVGSILDIDAMKQADLEKHARFRQMMMKSWEGILPGAQEREEFLEYTFRKFREADDFDAELKLALRAVGMAAKVGRVYLYEFDETQKEWRSTADWYADGVTPLTCEQEQMLYSMGYAEWEKLFDKNGVLCIPDTAYLTGPERAVTKELGIKAILQYKIEDNGHAYGFIGLDDYKTPRVWTSEQIEDFHSFVRLLSLYLIKNRAQKHSRQHEEELMTILNNQDIWAFVIDEDYCIRFLNEKARDFVPAGRNNLHCYEVFMRRNSPCKNCPAANIRETITASAEMENTYLNQRMRATATCIRWKGQNATLIRYTSAGNASLPESAPNPNSFKTVLHSEVLRHTGGIDRSEPELMMASLQVLLDRLPGMIYVKDMDLTYRAGNQAYAKMAGKASIHEVIGKTDMEIFEDQKLVQHYNADDRKLLTGGKNLIDYVEPITDDSGEARYSTTSKYILTSEGGRPVGLLGFMQDITKEMRSRYRYEKEVDYLFTLPRDVFAAYLIDIDDWRIIGQRAKSIESVELPAYDSIEHLLEDVKDRIRDESAKDALYFYEEFSPMQLRNLHNSGQSQIEMEFIFHFKNGNSLWVRNEIKFLTNPSNGHRCIMSVVRDIDSIRKSADEMARAANMDALTGVLSRGAGIRQIEKYLAMEGMDGTHAMFMIDVDNFKSVNDLFGHPVGDKLLRDLADALRSSIRESDLIVRMGGDEFLVFVKNIPNNKAVQKKAEKLLQAVRNVKAADTDAMISASIGISLYPENGTTHEALFVKADEALYRAKKSGKNRAAFASDEHVLPDNGKVAMRYEDYNSIVSDYSGVCCYIADLKTYEMLHMNRVIMEVYGIASQEGYKGRKCYEVLQGRSEPCPFCTNDKLQEGTSYGWIHKNEFLGKTFKINDRKLHINGRWCRIELAWEDDGAPEATVQPS